MKSFEWLNSHIYMYFQILIFRSLFFNLIWDVERSQWLENCCRGEETPPPPSPEPCTSCRPLKLWDLSAELGEPMCAPGTALSHWLVRSSHSAHHLIWVFITISFPLKALITPHILREEAPDKERREREAQMQGTITCCHNEGWKSERHVWASFQRGCSYL